MHVLWWVPAYHPDIGGIETLSRSVVHELSRAGCRVSVLVASGGPSVERDGSVDVIRLPILEALQSENPTRIARCIAEIRKRVASAEPTLHHVHLAGPAVAAFAMSIADERPVVATVHTDPSAILAKELLGDSAVEAIIRRAAVVTTVSTQATAHLAEQAPGLATRLVTVPNGIRPGPDPTPPPRRPRIAAIGRLVPDKRFDRVLEALPLVARTVPGVELLIVGDGPERESLERQAARLGVAPIVTFTGRLDQTEVRDVLDSAATVVLPSQREGLPLIALEAAAAGRPIVAARIGGVADVVIDGETGTLIEPRDLDRGPDRLAEHLSEMLTSAQAPRMGARARQEVERHHDLARTVDIYGQIYRAAVAPPADVAVIIPTFNGAAHLADTLDSLLADAEAWPGEVDIVVVDDGSQDRTPDIALEYTARGVRYVRQPHLGTAFARNAGMAVTRSTWVAHFDGDDLWPSGRLAALTAAANATDAVFGRRTEFDDDAPPNAAVRSAPVPVRAVTTGLIRRRVFDDVGGFRVDDIQDGLDWMSRALASGLDYRTTPDVVLNRRIHRNNNSHRRGRDVDAVTLAIVRDFQRRRTGGPDRTPPS